MRLDEYLLQNALVKNIRQGRGLILSGNVFINDHQVDKCGYSVKEKDKIRLKKKSDYISRASLKISPFLEKYPGFLIQQKKFLDIGASTGGFTSLLLQKGCEKIIALDVGYGLLHTSLRQNPRVICMERTHICKIKGGDLPFLPDAFVMDVSFIPSRRVVTCLLALFEKMEGLILFKPQFELEFCKEYQSRKKTICKEEFHSGVIRNVALREEMVADFIKFLVQSNIHILQKEDAFICGQKGNLEKIFWVHW